VGRGFQSCKVLQDELLQSHVVKVAAAVDLVDGTANDSSRNERDEFQIHKMKVATNQYDD
jgi:hypothetical protein